MILLRHTRPEGGEGVCYGASVLDVGPDFGAAAAAVLEGLPPITRLRSSPLRRCHCLAARIAAARGLRVETDPRLAEMDFGSWERLPWGQISRQELDAWAADFYGARPHGGESVAMLAERVAAALAEVRAMAGSVLWVTHAGVAKAAAAHLAHGEGWQTRLGFGEWLVLPAAGPEAESRTPRPRR